MHTSTAFTQDTQATIATLCRQLTQATGQTVTADYGSTDCGLFDDVLLSLASPRSFHSLDCHPDTGHPVPLVTLLSTPDTPGLFVVLGGAGDPVLSGVSLVHAAQAARFTAMRSYGSMG